MSVFDVAQIGIFLVLLFGLIPFLGAYMASVYEDGDFWGRRLFGPVESAIYRICRINAKVEMDWRTYASALLGFHLIGFFLLFLMQIAQSSLPWNPRGLGNVEPWLALNTSVSFLTNTNWQSYSGETTLSPFVQMLGLTVQNFVSAAVGMAVLIALIRGICRRNSAGIGNFWQDIVRSIVYILLPLSLILALVLAAQGVVQTLNDGISLVTGGVRQVLPLGPVASQEAIKQLGTNGGGYFGVNSAHPFENPTALTNLLEMLAIFLIPASLTYTFGRMIESRRQGWVLFAAMFILFIVGLAIMLYSELNTASMFGTFPWMEGKDVRFGLVNSVLWANMTTCASNGSVNMMHDSLTPLSGMVAMLNMMFGEIVFGGVGTGLYGMIVFVILTVFIAGLMVGRTPEMFGKKIEAFEIQMAIFAVFAPNFVILVFTALTLLVPSAVLSIGNGGPHGFSEILYAFTSAAGNNGSAFAGLSTNTAYYNIMLAVGMLIGRFGVILPVLAIAGSIAAKKRIPPSAGTLRTDSLLFVFLLISVVFIVGALTFFPALSLGPVIEHLLMTAGRTF